MSLFLLEHFSCLVLLTKRNIQPLHTHINIKGINNGKEGKVMHMIKTSKVEKREVSAMAECAFTKFVLTPQQSDKAMKEGLCYGCMGHHKFKKCPKMSKIIANRIVKPLQEMEDSEEDLLA